MKTIYKKLILGSTIGIWAGTVLFGQSVTVLDGFENGFTTNSAGTTNIAVFTTYGGRSAAGLVTIAPYTASNASDPNVTEGSHSMAITFGAVGFGNDFIVTLGDEASAAVELAASSNQVARYIFRYDVVFANPAQYVYFNQHAFIGADWNYVQLGGADSKGKATFSCALELPTLGLPAPPSGGVTNPISILFANQFNTTNDPAYTNSTIYIDNMRLVDTYAPGASPVTYPLQSFETSLGGATNLFPTVTSYFGNPVNGRATLRQFVTNGVYEANMATNGGRPGVFASMNGVLAEPNNGDFAVTDGTHALQISNTSPVAYQGDFAVPLAGTKLAQVLSLNLPPSQLAHYTLRWDTTMPAVRDGSFDGDYVNMVYGTGATTMPMAQGRRQYGGQIGLQRETYSVTLDQISAWGAAPTGGDPAIIFFFDGANEGIPYIYYYDNFQLVETAPLNPTIQSSKYNPATHQFTLTWLSEPGSTYSIVSSSNLVSGSFTNVLATGIAASSGSLTTNTVTVPAAGAEYLRVRMP